MLQFLLNIGIFISNCQVDPEVWYLVFRDLPLLGRNHLFRTTGQYYKRLYLSVKRVHTPILKIAQNCFFFKK